MQSPSLCVYQRAAMVVGAIILIVGAACAHADHHATAATTDGLTSAVAGKPA